MGLITGFMRNISERKNIELRQSERGKRAGANNSPKRIDVNGVLETTDLRFKRNGERAFSPPSLSGV
jgi:hypothetical protein